MTAKMKSFVKGILAGLAGKPLVFASGEPVPDVPVEPSMFTYGVSAPLPDIYTVYTNELQQQYPFALVYFSGFGWHTLCISTSPWYSTGEPHMDGDEQLGETIKNDSIIRYFDAQGFDSSPWVEYIASPDEPSPELGQSQGMDDNGQYEDIDLAVWANHIVMSADGKTVLVPKTDPIPIYE